MTREAAVVLAALLLAACASDPDPRGSATASATPSASFTQVGEGSVLEDAWTYGVGRDGDEWCTRLEVGEAETSRCGDLLPAGDDAFGEVGRGPSGYARAQVIEGFVVEEAATVWLIGGSGAYRNPAVLVPPDGVDVIGVQAFVGFADPDVQLTHLQAVGLNGDVLQTLELP